MKKLKHAHFIFLIMVCLATVIVKAQEKSSDYLNKRWSHVATKMPSEWYDSKEAKLTAENVLLAQKDIGGGRKTNRCTTHFRHLKNKSTFRGRQKKGVRSIMVPP